MNERLQVFRRQNFMTGVTDSYSYDALYQLTQVTRGASVTENYTYDAVGNRLSSVGISPWTYDFSNRLTGTPATSFTYDKNGNMLTKSSTSGTTVYSWDLENRLLSATVPGTGGGGANTVSFKYDPFGRRIQKASSSGTTYYLYDGANVVAEVSASGGIMASYAQGSGVDEPLAMQRSGYVNYYHADGLGSVTSLTNAAGRMVASYTYDSFGNTTPTEGIFNPFRYTAREQDPETGLYYYRARYYDPQIGRFISEDPIGVVGGLNFYRYVYNDPLGLADPSGLTPAEVGRVKARCKQCTKSMTDRGERNRTDSDSWLGKEILGYGNDVLSWFTKRKACWDQALDAKGCLYADPSLSGWSFDDIPVQFGLHHVVRAHNRADPNDPDVICDPWRNESYSVPRPPSGGGNAF